MRLATVLMSALVVVQLIACARLKTEDVTPAELAAAQEAAESGEGEWPSKLRATWPDGDWIVLDKTRLEGDTLIGTYCGNVPGRCTRTEMRIALQDLERIEVVTADRTTAQGVGIGVLLVGSVVALGFLAATLALYVQ